MASDPLVSLAAHSRFDASLASTFLHHKHQPPDIRHHRVPAPELSFSTPNLPFLLRTLAKLAADS